VISDSADWSTLDNCNTPTAQLAAQTDSPTIYTNTQGAINN